MPFITEIIGYQIETIIKKQPGNIYIYKKIDYLR